MGARAEVLRGEDVTTECSKAEREKSHMASFFPTGGETRAQSIAKGNSVTKGESRWRLSAPCRIFSFWRQGRAASVSGKTSF